MYATIQHNHYITVFRRSRTGKYLTMRDFVPVILLLLASCILTTTNALSSTNYRTRPFATAFRCPLCHLAAKSNEKNNSTASRSNSNGHGGSDDRLWIAAYSDSSSPLPPLSCSQGHSFDRSAKGYVNLLATATGGANKLTGDTTAMCQARREFLNQGHYQDLAEMVCSEVTGPILKLRDAEVRRQQGEKVAAAAASILKAEDESNKPPSDDDTPVDLASLPPRQRKLEAKRRRRLVEKDTRGQAQQAKSAAKAEAREQAEAFQRLPLVVDLGCGEGWYTKQLVDVLQEKSSSESKVGVARIAALDVSKDAAGMTARRFPAVVPPKKRIEGRTNQDTDPSETGTTTSAVHVDIAVANAKAILPFADDSVSVVVSIFAPRDTSELHRVINKKSDGNSVVVDVSKDAAGMTARRFPAVVPPKKRIEGRTNQDTDPSETGTTTSAVHVDIAVANAKAILPFADDSVSVVVSIFAPRDTSELHRVINKKSDGNSVVVIAQPNPRHLQELRTLEVGGRGLNFVRVEEDKERRVVDGMVAAGFVLSHQQTLEGSMTLSAMDVGNLVRMGPSAFHQTESSEHVLAELDKLEDFDVSVTKSFEVLVFEPVPDDVIS